MKYYTTVFLIMVFIGLVSIFPVMGEERADPVPYRQRASKTDRRTEDYRAYDSSRSYHSPRPVRTARNRPYKDESRRKRTDSLDISAEELNLTPLSFHGKDGDIPYCQAVENNTGSENSSLVVVLHGRSGCGNDNQRQLTSPAVKPLLNYIRTHSEKAVVLVPQCPANQDWVHGGSGSPIAIVWELVKAKCSEFNISSKKVYVTGVSMGGGACFRIMIRQPDLFSRAIIVSSGGRPEDASRLKGDFYIVHGEKDRLIPLAKAQAMVDAIRINSDAHVTFTVLTGKDHIQASQNAYSEECFRWLFQK